LTANLFLNQIHEDVEKDPFAIGIKGQLKNQSQGQDFSTNHNKFEFLNGLLYQDGNM
jgi:hypothetical protein